ncbi:MAG TPA: hypothetical protein ENI51_10240 [Candidatus Atribacteria bacterium]|nr:hypothetical protein [Candidatus Atribacteria bacterium]
MTKELDNICDFCGKAIDSKHDKFMVIDGDMILHSVCFIEIYKEKLEEVAGVDIWRLQNKEGVEKNGGKNKTIYIGKLS